MGLPGRVRIIPVIICALFLLTIASATAVTISDGLYADKAGFFLTPYYENANAPVTGCASPCQTVDTQTSEPTPNPRFLSLDGSATGTWTTGNAFTMNATTANANDVIVLWIITYKSGSSITVTSIADSLGEVVWQSAAREKYTACSGAQETTQTEWYGTSSVPITSDVITVTLGGTPTIASGEEFAVTGANLASPFDPDVSVPVPAVSTCTGTAASPTVSGLSTGNTNDFIFSLFGTHTSVTETAGAIAGATSTLMKTVAGTGDSIAAEYSIVSATQSTASCAFGKTSTYWGIACDAIEQAPGSFTLPAGSSMYLWSPQFGSATSIAAGALSFQLIAAPPPPALDGEATGTWASGTSFTITPFTTTNAQDVVVLSIVTRKSGVSIPVTSVSDSLSEIAWKGSARNSLVTCSGTQEETDTEWYGIAANAISADTITITLSAAPTDASGIAFGVSGADTTTPFDPASGLPMTGVSACTGTAATPTVSGVSTGADADFIFALFASYPSKTETAGAIGGATSTLVTTIAGTGESNAVEYSAVTASQMSISCAFGSTTTYWGVLCDALMPARQQITVAYTATTLSGAVYSTMIANSPVTITGIYQPISLPSSAGTVPASGYICVVITDSSGVPFTVYWGYGKPTLFEVGFTYQS